MTDIETLKAKLIATGHFSWDQHEEHLDFPLPRRATRPRFYGQDTTTEDTLANIERENINATSHE